MATAAHSFPKHDAATWTGMFVRLQPALCPTDDQFYEFCRLNRDLRIERDANRGVSVMPPAGWETADRNADITFQLRGWAMRDGTGRAVDSSAGYLLPNGAIRSPDASWVSNERLSLVPAEQRSRFLPLCPDFVIELRSPSDGLSALRDKMVEYVDNGAELGWLIDPPNRRVFVYRRASNVEEEAAPERLSGEPVLPGFRLRTDALW